MYEKSLPFQAQQQVQDEKAYFNRIQQAAGLGPITAGAISSSVLGSLKNEFQHPAQPPSVRSLLDIAYGQVAELEKEIARLGEQLLPVRELSPTQESDKGQGALGTPEVIGMLRGLIDRIARQQAVVRAIAGEIRI